MVTMGEIVKRYDFVSPDDAAAVEHARQYLERWDIEVWQLHRQVGVLGRTTRVA